MADDRAYRVILSFDGDSDVYRARVPELEIDVEGDARADAVAKAEAAIEERIDAVAQSGESLPPPADGTVTGGDLTLTLAPLVMRDLAFFAERNQQTKEELAAQLLARAIGMMNSPAPRRERRDEGEQDRDRDRDDRGRGRGKRRGEGYRPDLDDKSNWLAYLRDQEKGGGGRGRR